MMATGWTLPILTMALIGAAACSNAADGEPAVSPAASEAVEWSPAVVVYSSEGFAPERLEIAFGQTVTFVNKSQEPFLPASNIHPTHEIYAEFQAPSAVPAGESWEFTVDRPGFWRYHNHKLLEDAGLIVVARTRMG